MDQPENLSFNTSGETTPDFETSREERVKAAARKIVALSAVVTIIASGVATAHEGNLPGFISAAGATLTGHGHTEASAERTTAHFGPAEHPLSVNFGLAYEDLETTPVSEIVMQPVTETVRSDAPMPWALEFAQDPEAHNTDKALSVIEDVARQTKQYEADGYSVESISIQGFASDEDDAPGGGLAQPNQKNVELANTRAEAGKEVLVNQLHRQHIGEAVQIKSGHEVIDKALDKKIDELAAKKGISTLELVQQYNRHQGELSNQEAKLLDGLASDRFVRVEVTLSHNVPTLVKHVEIKTRSSDGSIIIVPFLIPVPLILEKPVVVATAPEFIEPLPPPRPKPETIRADVPPPRQLLHSTAIHRKMPRPHNYHGGQMSAKGKNSSGRHGRAYGGHKH